MNEVPSVQNDFEKRQPVELRSFVELAQYFAEKYPDSTKITVENEFALLKETGMRDLAVEEKGLRKTLADHNISTENMSEVGEGKWMIYYKKELVEDLPDGYGLKGGAARYYLRESLGLATDYPRDRDIVRLLENEPYAGADADIARRFMPKDFEFGDGVEKVLDIDIYFKTRDLTINEILATKKGIIATESAILDTVRNILRLTSFERYNYNPDGYAGPKMLAKLLRFYSEMTQLHDGAPSVLDIGHERIDMVSISPFWLAVNLDRAWERGRAYATDYTRTLLINNQLPTHVQTPEDAANYLLDCMRDESFIFRSAPDGDYLMEDTWIDQIQSNEDKTISEINKGITKR